MTENDYLDFMIRLHEKDNPILPAQITIALATNALLFIGYSLADWDFRVLFRSIFNSISSMTNLIVAVQLRPKDVTNEEAAIKYLSKYFGSVLGKDIRVRVFWGEAKEFAKELRDHWEANIIIGEPREQSIRRPQPFEQKDRNLFFGRDYETIEIISLILSNPLTLIYSQSGVGKTSLFNTKIMYELEKQYNFQIFPPTRVRSLISPEKIPKDVTNIYMFNTLLCLKPEAEVETLKKQSLFEFFKAGIGPQKVSTAINYHE